MEEGKLPREILERLRASGYTGAEEINPPEGEVPLNFAVASCPDLVQELIDLGSDVNAPCHSDGRTPLMHASFNPVCGLSIVELLLKSGADPGSIDRHGYSVFGLALAHRNGPMSARLLKAGATPFNCFPGTVDETTILAAAKGAVEILPLLVRSGLDMHAVDDEGRGVFHLLGSLDALVDQKPEKAIRILEDLWRHGVDISLKDRAGNTPLHIATNANPLLCQWLIHRGANYNERNKKGITPLMLASLEQPAVARLLLSHGASLLAKSHRGIDALMSACSFPSSLFERNLMAHHRIAGSLMGELPEDALTQPAHRKPALGALSFCKSAIPTNLACATITKDLLLRGASAEHQARDGSTALMCAARYQPENLGLLLECGANVNHRDKKGWTALMCASASSRPDLAVSILLAGGADPREAFEKEEVATRFEQHPKAMSLLQAAILSTNTQQASKGVTVNRL